MHFLRRAFRFPDELDRALLARFWGGQVPDAPARRPLEKALKELWPLLARDRGQDRGTRHYSGRREQAEAYAAYYLPANAMKLPLILEEAKLFGVPLTEVSPGETLRWLDVGSGPGTAYWGLAWWARAQGLATAFTGLEQSSDFLRLAGELAGKLAGELGVARTARWELFRHGTKGAGRTLAGWIESVEPRVVSLMNSVAELCPELTERRVLLAETVDALARAARADGRPRWLVLVEPGSKNASRELLELREDLRARDDVRIWLPCLSARPCGARANPSDWCHEEAAMTFPEWMDALGAAAGLRKEAVLFSYLVASVGVHPEAPAGWPKDGSRVVSQLMKEKGLTQCFLCTEGGKTRARVLDSRMTEEVAGFTRAIRGQILDGVRLSEKGDVQVWPETAAEADLTVFPPLR